MSKNVYDENVDLLINETKDLRRKYHKNIEEDNYKSAMECIKLLRSTLDLIKEYDWHLEYSEYEDVTDHTNKVSVWKQNHDGEVKDIKTWEIWNGSTGLVYNSSDMWITTPDISENKWVKMFEPFIEFNQSILFELPYKDRDAEKLHRSTGKTSSLVYLAMKYNIPILASSMLKHTYSGVKIYSSIDELRTSDNMIALVDEGFYSSNVLDDLKDNWGYTFIGFKPINYKK